MTGRRAVLLGLWLIALSCADDEATSTSPTGVPGRTSDLVNTSETSATATTSVSVAPVEDDGAVLAAAVLWRATVGNSWDDPGRFAHIYVVERLGRADADGFITGVESGRALTHAERSSVEAALAPRTVQWVESWNAVVDERATTTLPEDRAIITVAEPLVEDRRAEVATELWCGYTCGIGSTSVLELSPSGDWVVVDQLGGYIS